MRQIVLDTETTGLEPSLGHRIIEVGCVELLNRRVTGRSFHRYLNPERDIDLGAEAVHGLQREDLARQPRFVEIADELLEFIGGSELVIHNAEFDIAFLDAELRRAGRWQEVLQASERVDAPMRAALDAWLRGWRFRLYRCALGAFKRF